MSATLLILWACAWIFEWPVVGNYNFLFLAALALQWPDYQFRRRSKAFSILYPTILAMVAGAIVFAAYALGDTELRAIMHSPYFALPAWAIGFSSIVINSTPVPVPSGSQTPTAAG